MQAPTSEYASVVFLRAEMKGFLLRVPDWTRTILDVEDTFPRGVVTDVKPDASVKVKTADLFLPSNRPRGASSVHNDTGFEPKRRRHSRRSAWTTGRLSFFGAIDPKLNFAVTKRPAEERKKKHTSYVFMV